jgi:hypothetical protein
MSNHKKIGLAIAGIGAITAFLGRKDKVSAEELRDTKMPSVMGLGVLITALGGIMFLTSK